MDISLAGIGTLLTGFGWLFFYYKLRKNTATYNDFIRFFKGFSFFFAMFFITFSLPLIVVPDMTIVLSIAHIIGHTFSYIAFAYLARVALLLSKPSFNSFFVFVGYLIAGAGVTSLNLYYFNYPYLADGLVHWSQHPLVSVAVATFSILAILPVALLFMKEAIVQSKNRRNYGLISMSLMMTIIAGPMHDAATSSTILIVADLLTILSCVLMFAGVITRLKSVKVHARASV